MSKDAVRNQKKKARRRRAGALQALHKKEARTLHREFPANVTFSFRAPRSKCLSPLEEALEDPLEPSEQTRKNESLELLFEALHADDRDTTVEKIGAAFRVDPMGCLDSLGILADVGKTSPDQLADVLSGLVNVAEQAFGSRFVRENRGRFWGILETRPYMRLRARLADALLAAGRLDEAVEQYEAMMLLNPNDNQGIRHLLLGCYLAARNVRRARWLLKEYKEDGTAMFAWGLVLERFLSGDQPGALRALHEARPVNHLVEPYLTAKKRLPRKLPDFYGIGDKDEAVVCADAIGLAWQQNPDAVLWLKLAAKSIAR